MLHLLWVVRWRGINNSFRWVSRPMSFHQAMTLVSNPRNSRAISEYWIEPVPLHNKDRTMQHDTTPSPPIDFQALAAVLGSPCKGGYPKILIDDSSQWDGRARKLRIKQDQARLERSRTKRRGT